ncbi:ssDNA endodeoxyribonuclease RAD2 [Lachancea thermotolerans CBS 6340]|uniref:KLTH0B08756p n=1 Tax=Lachancea thermotolerans (strain ATCC 56472 / CBS 6340 / NRRL Y-8284) TaxID=559295 RepID=C5DD69_LACTC|nr:KLTH0B08756p [Lachancea thermotolerans CBS 6340]CAR21730.1 KLTH0B08756p [Lachancea thermotolerans CBS 6340]
MGVHALWDIVGPTAKPVRLESLSNKRLAVDASIWIYQFLKAVRDKEGNAMRYSHVVGFFRRICKLLYFGIKPVFVFDGGAPALKRRTIQQRKERRQGRRDNAVSTAKKLLALQMQNGDRTKNKENASRSTSQTHVHRQDDEYDLPKIPGFKYEEGDARINADDFKTIMENIDELDGVDLDAVNPASREFEELPKSTQYMILSALRLKSRLRMGYSKEQLEEIFPDSMEFSKFQIDMVKRRNFFTQKLMSATNTHDGGASKSDTEPYKRVAGQRGKEYQLIRTENGWALSLTGNDGSEISKAIVVDEPQRKMEGESRTRSEPQGEDDEDEDIDWEDVDVEKKKSEKELDYSIKASMLSVKANTVRSGGGQSFLDRRTTETRDKGPQSKFVYVSNEPELIDDEDEDEDDFSELTKEIQLMEDVKNGRGKRIEEIQTDNSIPQRQEQQKAESKKPSSSAPFSYENEPASVKDRIEVADNSDEVGEQEMITEDEVREKSQQNSRFGEFIAPSYPQNKASHDGHPKVSSSQAENKKSSNSEQNLQFVLDKINNLEQMQDQRVEIAPANENPEGHNSDVIHAHSRAPEHDERPVQETPAWFRSAPDFNPHLGTSFLTSTTEKEPEQTDDEQLGLLTGSKAAELLYERDVLNKENEANGDQSSAEEDVIEIAPPESLSADKPSEGGEEEEIDSAGTQGKAHVPVVDYDFSEDEEDALVHQLREEEQDYNAFKTSLNPSSVNATFVDEELHDQHLRDKRDSDEVTAAMVAEVQDLLTRFGIPFMTAPMEAEAQCAELLMLGLVDGIITDDSDIFLFGGDKVYKNMFQEKNYVEYYYSDLMKKELGLDREKFIELAQLLGSDYTTGVKSVGPVSAMEILAEFGNLHNFRNWYSDGQFNKKKQEEEPTFEKRLRKKLVTSEVILDTEFPSDLVKEAYLRPEVDHDATRFTWGVPDLDRLRSFFQSTIGWPQEKTDEVMIPLIREVNNRKKTGIQNTLTNFFPSEYIKASKDIKLGKRIKNASGKLKMKKQRTE